MYFYDTCSLLNELSNAFKQKFLISTITLKELENIKTSFNKDDETKYRARQLTKLLSENENLYTVVPFLWEEELNNLAFLPKNDDSRIILSACHFSQANPKIKVIFCTQDLSCYSLAKNFHNDNFQVVNKVHYINNEYTGFIEIVLNEEELANFYNTINDYNENNNPYNLLINQYLIIKDKTQKVIDQYKYTGCELKRINFSTFKSQMFGCVKPKDIYQQLAMDSLANNQITMIRGAAGSGKSYLSFAYLFELLDKHKIDKIIIFCNTVATAGSARLGFYPGTKNEKLLDSQIGNLLASKIGNKIAVEKMIEEETLILLPMSDIRGYDTTGMNAGIYISEAQNLDIELIRLALQRIGEDSICILDGDSDAQVDLPLYGGYHNGMKRVSEVFKNHDFYGEITLQNIHRSKIAALAQEL